MRRLAILLAIITITTSLLAVPSKMFFQGKFTDDMGDPIDGVETVITSIWDSGPAGSGGLLWCDTNVVVFNTGLFVELLGDDKPIPDSCFQDGFVKFLEIQVGDALLEPRKPLVTVPYAFHAALADSVVGGSVNYDSIIAYIDTLIHDTLGAYLDTTWRFDLDTLGAYLDTTFAGSISHIDSISYIDSISFIDSVLWIYHITHVDSISFIDSVSYIRYISFIDSITHIDSVSYIAHISYIDSIAHIDSMHWIDSIGYIDFISYIDSVGYIDSIGWIGSTNWADSAHWAGYVHWDSIDGIPDSVLAGEDHDWQISGDDMYSIPTGNVGIGTTTPVAKLDVEGNSIINGTVMVGGNYVGSQTKLTVLRKTDDPYSERFGIRAIVNGIDTDSLCGQWAQVYYSDSSTSDAPLGRLQGLYGTVLNLSDNYYVDQMSGLVGQVGASGSAGIDAANDASSLMLMYSFSGTNNVKNLYGANIYGPTNGSVNNYGIYVRDASGGTGDNYSIYSVGDNYFGGDVGIGVNPPRVKLDVDGDVIVNKRIRAYNDSSSLGLHGANTIHSGAYIDLFSADYPSAYGGKVRIRYGDYNDVAPTTACVDIRMNSDSTVYPVMMMDYDRNVGIGTTTPTAKLDVLGNVNVRHKLFVWGVDDDPVADSVLTIDDGQIKKIDAATLVGSADADWQISGDDLYSLPTGNVGIGTTSPDEKLDVFGNALISERMKIGTSEIGTSVDSSYKLLVVDDVYSTDPYETGFRSKLIGINKPTLWGTWSTTYYSDSSTAPGSVYGGVFGIAQNQSFTNPLSSLIGIWGQVGATGLGGIDAAEYAIALQADYHFPGSNSVSNLYGLRVSEATVFGSENNYGIWVNDAYGGIGDNYSIYSVGDNYFGGDVGIGVNPPNAKLDVNGNVNVRDTLFIGGIADDPAPDSVLTIVDGEVMKAAYGSGTDADWQISGDDMYSMPTGNVGIGTTTPEEKVDVLGNFKLDGNAAIGFWNVSDRLKLGISDYARESDSLEFGIKCVMYGIDKDSLVGLNAGVYYSDSSTSSAPEGIYQGVFGNAVNWSDTNSVKYLLGLHGSVGVTGSGEIDAASFAAALWLENHFSGTNKVTNLYGAYIRRTQHGSVNNYGIYLQDASGGTGDNFSIYSVGDNYFGGDVGIGVNPPTAKLDVNGNVNVGDTLFIGDVANDPAPDSVLTFVDGQVMKAAYGGGADADWQISGDDMYSIPTGNVGIGTLTPYDLVHLDGLDSTNNVTLKIQNRYSSLDTAGAELYLCTSTLVGSEGVGSKILARRNDAEGPAGSTDLHFKTSYGTTMFDRMILKTNGDVGIGTIAPTAKLDVNGNVKVGDTLLIGDVEEDETTDSLLVLDNDGKVKWTSKEEITSGVGSNYEVHISPTRTSVITQDEGLWEELADINFTFSNAYSLIIGAKMSFDYRIEPCDVASAELHLRLSGFTCGSDYLTNSDGNWHSVNNKDKYLSGRFVDGPGSLSCQIWGKLNTSTGTSWQIRNIEVTLYTIENPVIYDVSPNFGSW